MQQVLVMSCHYHDIEPVNHKPIEFLLITILLRVVKCLTILLREVSEEYFQNGLKEHLSTDYILVGFSCGISMLQGGSLPIMFSPELVDTIFSTVSPSGCISLT